MKSFIQKKIVAPFLLLLKQGSSPIKLSQTISFGVIIGTIPIVGVTTALCTLIVFLLGLNLPAIQIVNYLMFPVQIALYLPFMHLGAYVFDVDLPVSSFNQIERMLNSDWQVILFEIIKIHALGVIGWAFVSFVLYFPLQKIIHKLIIMLPTK